MHRMVYTQDTLAHNHSIADAVDDDERRKQLIMAAVVPPANHRPSKLNRSFQRHRRYASFTPTIVRHKNQ